MKRVKDIIKLQENIEPSGETEFTNPESSSSSYDDNQGGSVTGGGRVQNYPVSAANIRWIREQGGTFSFGFLGAFSLENLTKILLGSDLSASVIKDADTEYDTLGDRQVDEQNAAIAYFNGEYQTIRSGYQAQYDAAIAAENYVAANTYSNLLLNGPHVQEYNRLTAIYTATAAERSALLTRMSDYIMGGKINPSDPYGLDHPELAGQDLPKKKKKPGDPGYDPEVDGLPDLSPEEMKAELQKLTKNDPAVANILQQFGSAAKTYIDYLTGQLPDKIDNNYLGDKYVNSIFKDATVNHLGTITVGDNIVGTGGKATYNPKTGKVSIPFNYDFDTNAEQIAKDPQKYNYEPGLNRLAMNAAFILGGDYGLDSIPVPLAGWATMAAKQFGGGKHRPGEVTMDADKLKKLNPSLYNQLVKEQKFSKDNLILTESKKRVIKNIKKPYEVPELPKKYKMNFAGKYSAQNTPDKTASQVSDALVASGNAKGQRWRQKDKDWVGYETTERMNVVYDKVGHGDQYWKMIVGDNARKKKDRELQEKLNIVAHENALMQENPNYETPFNKNHIDEQETLSADKDPLFKKVSKSLKKSIDYPDKPAKAGYPNDPPPKMINGYHPDLVNGQKVSNYYNRLDPASAMAMPKTGNDSIDSKVDLAKNGEYPKDSPAAATAAKRHGLDKLRSNPRTDANVKRISDAKRRARKLKNLKGKG